MPLCAACFLRPHRVMSWPWLLATQLAVEVVGFLFYSTVLMLIALASESHVRRQLRARMRVRRDTQTTCFAHALAAAGLECVALLQDAGASTAAVFWRKVLLCLATLRLNTDAIFWFQESATSSPLEILVLSVGECGGER